MLSLRSLGRAAPRAVFRPSSLRTFVSASRNTFLRPSWQARTKPSYPAFSTSVARWEPAGEADLELSEKFNLERQIELDSSDPHKMPESIEEFLKSSQFEIIDKEGTHEVALVKSFGNETIKVEFSISDMNQIQEEDEFDESDEDGALEDEDYGQSKRTINQSGARGGPIDVVPEDSVAPADRGVDGPGADAITPSFGVNLTVTIKKPGKPAIEFHATAQDGSIEIDSVNYFPNADLLEAKTSEQAVEARAVYAGPPFPNLDADLQSMLEAYLESRGVDAQLANFLPEYVDWKEQREYVQWLQNMKDFIDA